MRILLNSFFSIINHTFCEAILANTQNVFFLKNNMGISMKEKKKNTRSADLYVDQIDVITKFSL